MQKRILSLLVDNTAGVYNCQTRRTKTVYTIDELIKAVDKIVKG